MLDLKMPVAMQSDFSTGCVFFPAILKDKPDHDCFWLYNGDKIRKINGCARPPHICHPYILQTIYEQDYQLLFTGSQSLG